VTFVPKDNRELIILRILLVERGLGVAALASRICMTEAATRGKLVSLRHRGYVTMPYTGYWRLTTNGEELFK
jgi:hypothetical protein